MRKTCFWLSLLAVLIAARVAADPNALWHIVHEQCALNQQQGKPPAPCVALDQSPTSPWGYAVLKSREGRLQYLLIPTTPISGIEDPALLSANQPNYWQAAWQARRFMSSQLGAPIARDNIALSINSPYGRTQEQLHIHISCVDPDVYNAVATQKDQLNDSWQPLAPKLQGHVYLARRLEALPGDLPADNPFHLLADQIPDAARQMSHYTLAMLALTFSDGKPGFVLLAGHTDLLSGNRGSAEELQDHSCRVLNN